MLTLTSLWKFYGECAVLRDLSYSFEKNHNYLISGENGAGKTSLLSVLAGHGSFQEGKVEYLNDGFHLDFDSLKNAEISSSFTSQGSYDFLTPRENLILSSPLCPLTERERITDEMLELFKLSAFRDTPYQKLSRGYQQRTNLASAFINRPQWIILDEPTVFLDSEGIAALEKAIKLFYHNGSSFIVSSHDKVFKEFYSLLNCTEIKLINGQIRSGDRQ